MSETTKFLLEEKSIPKAWYNIQADLPQPLPPVIHPGTGRADRPGRPGAALPDGADRAGGEPGALDRDPRPGAGGLPALAADAALPRAAPREGARYPGAHLLQVRGRLAGRLAQAEHGDRAGLLQPRGGHQGPDDRDRRGPVGELARDGVQLLRHELRGLHGEGLVHAEAVPPQHHESVRRRCVREPLRAHERRPIDPRAGPGLARLARDRDLGGGRGRRDERRDEEVLARLGAEPRAHAPDGDRARGARAVRAGRRVPGRRDRLRRRRLELRAASRFRSSATTSSRASRPGSSRSSRPRARP